MDLQHLLRSNDGFHHNSFLQNSRGAINLWKGRPARICQETMGEAVQWEALNRLKKAKRENTWGVWRGLQPLREWGVYGLSKWERLENRGELFLQKSWVERAVTGLRERLHTKLGTKKPIFSSTPNSDTHKTQQWVTPGCTGSGIYWATRVSLL